VGSFTQNPKFIQPTTTFSWVRLPKSQNSSNRPRLSRGFVYPKSQIHPTDHDFLVGSFTKIPNSSNRPRISRGFVYPKSQIHPTDHDFLVGSFIQNPKFIQPTTTFSWVRLSKIPNSSNRPRLSRSFVYPKSQIRIMKDN